jgi:hypothetical protein
MAVTSDSEPSLVAEPQDGVGEIRGCPRCGSTVRLDRLFCISCGAHYVVARIEVTIGDTREVLEKVIEVEREH